jgi:indole-3-glycerol phosphate synthase
MSFLDQIIERKRVELNAARAIRSLDELERMVKDAAPVRPFATALSTGFGIIAEIKKRSPSGGEMRPENVAAAPVVYGNSRHVKAVSVLTNASDFGMQIEDMARVKAAVPQPVLRKDFIFDEYQIYEARAFGADALLLMVNVLEKDQMRRLFEVTADLGMDVLFEVHTREETDDVPDGAKVYGVNSRKFKATAQWEATQKNLSAAPAGGNTRDFTVDLDTFGLIEHLPKTAIKVAESGLNPAQLPQVIKMGYNAVLVGTSLLKAKAGIAAELKAFEAAIPPEPSF